MKVEGDKTPIRRQHVISQVLLKRFADASNGLVSTYNVVTGSTRQSSPKSIGFVPDYVSHQPWAAERLWQTVESRLAPVFAALDAGHGALVPEHLETIADCVALHFSRSIESRQIHDSSFAKMEQSVLEDQHKLKQLAFLKHGRHLEEPDILTSIADKILQELREGNGSGSLFQDWVEEVFQKTCSYLGSGRVTIHYCDDGVELILGDSPSIGFRPGMQPTNRIPLYDAAAVLMPLGPRALVAIDWGSLRLPSAEQVQQEHALFINRIQAMQAHNRVYYSPTSGLKDFVRKCRPPTVRYPRQAGEP